jgi:hypothetical protein
MKLAVFMADYLIFFQKNIWRIVTRSLIFLETQSSVYQGLSSVPVSNYCPTLVHTHTQKKKKKKKGKSNCNHHITFADNASVNHDVEFRASVPVVLSAYNSVNLISNGEWFYLLFSMLHP